MDLKERIESFAELGKIIRESLDGKDAIYSGRFEKLIEKQQYVNPWFTPENVRLALSAISTNLTHEKIMEWTRKYPALEYTAEPSTIGIVMAGNIPLVGFHDFLSVLISGNRVLAKTSSKDPELPVALAQILIEINDGFEKMIEFTDGFLKNFDAVIATGSNNTSRYFEYYFGKYPNLIRKNRNSIAILTGSEDDSELEKLGEDIFSYFGLGCRNVSKLYLPEDYNIDKLKTSWVKYSELINHTKYGNNYDYHKAVFMVNREAFDDCGHFILKEEKGLASPVSVIFYEFYRRDEDFSSLIGSDMDKIQCIVGKGMVEFGKTQWPELWNYADNIDTIEFILKKNKERKL